MACDQVKVVGLGMGEHFAIHFGGNDVVAIYKGYVGGGCGFNTFVAHIRYARAVEFKNFDAFVLVG